MRRLRKLKMFGLLPAAIWLFSSAIMAGLLAPAAAVAGVATYETAGQPFAIIVLCTSNGIISQGPANDDGGKSFAACPWCQAFGKAPQPSPPDLLAALPSLAFDIVRPEPEEQLPANSIRISYFQSRAPPL